MRFSFLLAFGLVLALPAACSSAFTTAGGSGGSGGSSSASGGGNPPGAGGNGSGGGFACSTANDCPPATSQCETVECKQGRCYDSAVAAGDVPNPLRGNCMKEECDGSGHQVSVVDATDTPDDGNPCTRGYCSLKGEPKFAAMIGHPCGAGGTMVCDAMGQCVECNHDADCTPPDTCELGQCVNLICTNGMLDAPEETDIDCGGICAPCTNGKHCDLPSDCQSGVCNGTCFAPTCSDGVKNQNETDVDCGGGPTTLGCLPCPNGKHCMLGRDCQSGVCNAGTCAPPSCHDGVKNGNETDVDCGGQDNCPRCPDTKACNGASDCQSNGCDAQNECDHCVNMVRDGGETDVDCGGSCAATCDVGQMCDHDSDCASQICCDATNGQTGKQCSQDPCMGG
ncbi:MAG TPA: hypothetical protein VHB21_18725 [Minicystis sp.]|nr:hypothetical protein [Minicystis sp.]